MTVNVGILQDPILGPVLLLVFIIDLPEVCDEAYIKILYADDTTFGLLLQRNTKQQ